MVCSSQGALSCHLETRNEAISSVPLHPCCCESMHSRPNSRQCCIYKLHPSSHIRAGYMSLYGVYSADGTVPWQCGGA